MQAVSAQEVLGRKELHREEKERRRKRSFLQERNPILLTLFASSFFSSTLRPFSSNRLPPVRGRCGRPPNVCASFQLLLKLLDGFHFWAEMLQTWAKMATEKSPSWKGLLRSGTARIPNHRAPNHHLTIGWKLEEKPPIWNLCSSNWNTSPQIGVKIKNHWTFLSLLSFSAASVCLSGNFAWSKSVGNHGVRSPQNYYIFQLGFYSQWPPVTQFGSGRDWDELNRRERPDATNFLNATLVQPPKKVSSLETGILLTSKVTKKIISVDCQLRKVAKFRWIDGYVETVFPTLVSGQCLLQSSDSWPCSSLATHHAKHRSK